MYHVDRGELLFLGLVHFLLRHLIGTSLAESGKNFIGYPIRKSLRIGLTALEYQLVHAVFSKEIFPCVVQFSDVNIFDI